jgi:hypothetical protein
VVTVRAAAASGKTAETGAEAVSVGVHRPILAFFALVGSKVDPVGSKVDPVGSKMDPVGSKVNPRGNKVIPVGFILTATEIFLLQMSNERL